MPITPIDYQKTIIYKIVCTDLNVKDIYIGSTTDFKRRKYQHKFICESVNHYKSGSKKYVTIRNNGGWKNWEMIEIEKYPCNDNNEARARERHWYEQFEKSITLNTYCPFQSEEERKEVMKNYMKNNNKKYTENNKETKREYDKIYREANKDKLKDKKKEYIKANKDKINERRRLRRAEKTQQRQTDRQSYGQTDRQ